MARRLVQARTMMEFQGESFKTFPYNHNKLQQQVNFEFKVQRRVQKTRACYNNDGTLS
jgi:hypothetical protein